MIKKMSSKLKVCVIGAGMTGLSTAVNLQKVLHNAEITIIADKFGNETLTPVTRRIFLPRKTSNIIAVDPNFEWFNDSWSHHFSSAKSSDRETTGHSLISGYYLWNQGDSPVVEEAVFNYHTLSDDEMNQLDFKYKYNYGCRFTTVLVDTELYIRWMMKKFRENRGTLLYDKIFSLRELYGKYDIVVNCTGARSYELISDPGIVAVKGHVVRVRHVHTDNFLVTSDDISLIPSGTDGVVDLGYVWEPGVYRPGLDKPVIKELLKKTRDFFPFLQKCGVVSCWSERKPYRKSPLVEIETIDCNGASLSVVHSVALGPDTLSLAWGVATHVAHLVQELGRQMKPFNRRFMPFMTTV